MILTAVNARHIGALTEELGLTGKRAGVAPLRTEGVPESGWVLMDFGDVIVHLFDAAARERYALEHLWGRATPVVRIQ